MPSDRRLHPLSILFAFIAQLRAFVVPGALLLLGATTRGGDWEPWMMLFVIPPAIAAAVRYAFFRYRYEPGELVIRQGLFFKKERHIPYARIQNVDAVQRLLHRLLNVVEVRVQTGSGSEPEATMSELPFAAFDEMRRRVLEAQGRTTALAAAMGAAPAVGAAAGAARGAGAESHDVPAAASRPSKVLLHLDVRELLLSGFIENRGAVVIAAGMGLVWELGIFERLFEGPVAQDLTARGALRALVRGVASGAGMSAARVGMVTAGIATLLLAVRLLSMAWAAVRLHGFTVTLEQDDLRTAYGLLTRITATIPLRRIQTLTVRETPLHRLFGRVSVRAGTAGGHGKEGAGSEREWLAPILRREALPAFVSTVLPGTDLLSVGWQPVSPRAVRREFKQGLVVAALVMAAAAWLLQLWSVALLPVLVPLLPVVVALAALGARQTIKHMGWATTGEAVMYRSGWLWRRVTIVRYAKIQTVTCAQTPFDRRAVMARVRVDTAGGSDAVGRVAIPYLPIETARALFTGLSEQAARTAFRWS